MAFWSLGTEKVGAPSDKGKGMCIGVACCSSSVISSDDPVYWNTGANVRLQTLSHYFTVIPAGQPPIWALAGDRGPASAVPHRIKLQKRSCSCGSAAESAPRAAAPATEGHLGPCTPRACRRPPAHPPTCRR